MLRHTVHIDNVEFVYLPHIHWKFSLGGTNKERLTLLINTIEVQNLQKLTDHMYFLTLINGDEIEIFRGEGLEQKMDNLISYLECKRKP